MDPYNKQRNRMVTFYDIKFHVQFKYPYQVRSTKYF